MKRSPLFVCASLTAFGLALGTPAISSAQVELGPKVEKTYGEGLPRDGRTLIFSDDQYPVWPLTPAQKPYAIIDGARMKRQVIDLAEIAIRYRDAGHKWWGRFPGTTADREGMADMTRAFESLGLKVEHFPYTLPDDWRPTDWAASYTTPGGTTIQMATAFPVSGTKATGPQAITAEAVWVGIGAGADFIGRDVKGKAVVIYSTFVPGGRSHSASDRAGLFNSNRRAVELGAAMVINVMGVPGNGQFQPEGGLPQIPQITLSQDEGFALRDRLDKGEKIVFSLRLEVPELRDVATEYTIATLPGRSDEQIVVMTHTDGYFQAAMDNAAGMASALEIARFYAQKPLAERPRTMTFIQFSDHHHGEVARGRSKVGIDATYPWNKVAVKLTMEHPSQTLLYMYNDGLTPTNAVGAFRWNALGSPEFEQMVFDTLREFGVSVYAQEDGPKNGNYAPSFHIIDHVIYHTSLDIPELVPASGLERSTRAFVAALDRANAMTMTQLRGATFPAKTGQGSITGTQASSDAPRNDLPQLYRTTRDWGQLPPSMTKWPAVTAVEPAPDGTVYVVARCVDNSCTGRNEPPILKYDASGKLLKAWGEGLFHFPHGAALDRDGNLWVTDARGADGKGHQVFKFDPNGKVLMTLGKAGVSGSGPDVFDQPTDVVVAPNGDIFVTDSHRNGKNNRVAKFSKDGTYIKEWGTKGSGPGQISEPHTIAMDSQGRLFVGDRENNRIQIFDQDGKYITEWRQFGRPSGIYITRDDTIYVADSESGPDTGAHELMGIKKGIRIGSAKTGVVSSFIEDMEPLTPDHSGAEGLGVDAQGNVYGAVVRRQMLERHVRK